ncbi:8-amino-7-oxononanoate synthase [Talaromyces islandicus]|uniref:8-amino-7-oxononanoate synthase n=1 Tax=Talaromyces islandicus TaxID=28573 RepID=A0A0U1LUK5_TALIS|nr:8-amino-7-oxononanoate synthase [Talaromyces islandicus]
MVTLLESFQRALDQREAKLARRRLTVLSPDAADFSSNDFLSLSTSSLLKSRYLRKINACFASHNSPGLGSGGSRLLDGNSSFAEELEKFISAFHDAPDGLLFNSGFDANVGVFSCVPQSGDAIVYDELIHASTHEGMRLSRAARKVPFEHNSVDGLGRVLQDLMKQDPSIAKGTRNVFIAVESLYSMDGDVAPLKEIIQTMRKLLTHGNAYLIVDEAHATGVFGPKGAGVVQEQGVQKDVFLRTHTFGKALASQGAIVLCTTLTREYLINYARTLIYTTAMASPTLVAIRVAYELMQQGKTQALQQNLQSNISYLRACCDVIDDADRSIVRIDHHDQSPIFSIRTKYPRELARYCQQRGLIVRPIMAPTVPLGKERVRVCLHAGNTRHEIDRLVGAIQQWTRDLKTGSAKLYGSRVFKAGRLSTASQSWTHRQHYRLILPSRFILVVKMEEKPEFNTRYLIRQPLALQWFDNGKLCKRSEEERQASRFELFLDLLYVAILANFAETLAEDVTGVKLVKYILILSPSWHVWSDLRELMNSFYNDDLLQRILILWIMAILVVYGNNAPLVDEDISAMRSAVGAYIVARMSATLAHLYYSFSSYHHRAQQRLWFGVSVVGMCLYIPLFVESIPLRRKIAVAVVAIVYEEVAWVFCYSPIAKRLLRARYTTAVDVSHEIDRFAAFYIIALGEFLYTIVVGSPAATGFNLSLLRSVWTLIIAFCLNWMYLHSDCSVESTHPLRHSTVTALSWAPLHLPLIASLLAGGHVAAASAKPTTSEEEAASTHEDSGGEEGFSTGQRWLLCASLGVGILCLYAISLLHISKDSNCTLILPKPLRLIMRPVVGIILVLLPLAHRLNLTETLSIIMALIVFCVIWENVTSLQRGAKVWESWTETKYPEGGNRGYYVSKVNHNIPADGQEAGSAEPDKEEPVEPGKGGGPVLENSNSSA